MDKTATQLRDERMLRISRQVADRRAALEGQILAERGVISPHEVLLLDSLSEVERMRLEAVEQVQEQGLRERYYNGRQTLERENKAVGQALKASVSEAKIVSALHLGQKRRGGKAEDAEEKDDEREPLTDEAEVSEDVDLNDY